MRRLSILLFAWMLGLASARGADDAPLSRWYSLGTTNAGAAAAHPVVTNATFELQNATGRISTVWALFDPIPWTTGRSVTVSCRIRVPEDFPPKANDELRIGVFGTVAGTDPATKRQSDLRGFALMGGSAGPQWGLRLSEHATSEGAPIRLAGLKEHRFARVVATGGRGSDARIVLTVKKNSPTSVTCSGFWADMPFSFDVTPLAGDYTHLCAVALLRGQNSGAAPMTVSNVRVRID